MNDLKPCPFCGSKPEIRRYGGKYSAECPNDDCEVRPETFLKYSSDEAVKAWNRRANE